MTEDQFERLAVIIKEGNEDLSAEVNERFDEMEQRFEKRFDQIDARFEKVEENIRYILAELRDIRHDLETLKTKAANHAGFSKEIDHVLSRVVVIEKHLGIMPATA